MGFWGDPHNMDDAIRSDSYDGHSEGVQSFDGGAGEAKYYGKSKQLIEEEAPEQRVYDSSNMLVVKQGKGKTMVYNTNGHLLYLGFGNTEIGWHMNGTMALIRTDSGFITYDEAGGLHYTSTKRCGG